MWGNKNKTKRSMKEKLKIFVADLKKVLDLMTDQNCYWIAVEFFRVVDQFEEDFIKVFGTEYTYDELIASLEASNLEEADSFLDFLRENSRSRDGHHRVCDGKTSLGNIYFADVPGGRIVPLSQTTFIPGYIRDRFRRQVASFLRKQSDRLEEPWAKFDWLPKSFD